MARYAVVYETLWTGETGRLMRRAGPDALLTAAYLITGPDTPHTGLAHVTPEMVQARTGLPADRAEAALGELQRCGFLERHGDGEAVFVVEMAYHQLQRCSAKPMSPLDNRAKWLAGQIREQSRHPLFHRFQDRYEDAFPIKGAWPRKRPKRPLPENEGASTPTPEDGIPDDPSNRTSQETAAKGPVSPKPQPTKTSEAPCKGLARGFEGASESPAASGGEQEVEKSRKSLRTGHSEAPSKGLRRGFDGNSRDLVNYRWKDGEDREIQDDQEAPKTSSEISANLAQTPSNKDVRRGFEGASKPLAPITKKENQSLRGGRSPCSILVSSNRARVREEPPSLDEDWRADVADALVEHWPRCFPGLRGLPIMEAPRLAWMFDEWPEAERARAVPKVLEAVRDRLASPKCRIKSPVALLEAVNRPGAEGTKSWLAQTGSPPTQGILREAAERAEARARKKGAGK